MDTVHNRRGRVLNSQVAEKGPGTPANAISGCSRRAAMCGSSSGVTARMTGFSLGLPMSRRLPAAFESQLPAFASFSASLGDGCVREREAKLTPCSCLGSASLWLDPCVT